MSEPRYPTFHLSIGVRSMEASVDFFVRVLRARVQHRDPLGYLNVDFYGTQITLKSNPSVVPELPDFHFGMNLSLPEFELLANNIQREANGAIVMSPTVVEPNTKMERRKMYVKCPTGYLIEIKGYKNSFHEILN